MKLMALSEQLKHYFLRVPVQEQLVFIKNLAVMIKAGLPILDSLKMLQTETKSKVFKKILKEIIGDVSNGQSLSTGLSKFRDVFGELFINIIEVGETSGILAENLNYLAQELKKGQELKKKIIGALIYPAVIFSATIGITTLLTVFIFPKILPVFKTMKVTLPLTTRILIALSDLLTNYGLLIVLIIIIVVIISIILLRIPRVRLGYHILLLHTPLVGKMVRGANLASFTRILGISLRSGVKIVDAISITARSTTNLVYKIKLMEITDKIKKGQTIAEHLIPLSHLFPGMFAQMVAVGENTGNLSETLLYLSEFYESELDDLTKNLSNTLEPFLMVFMGIVVGFIAISIIGPIYEVTSSLQK